MPTAGLLRLTYSAKVRLGNPYLYYYHGPMNSVGFAANLQVNFFDLD